MCLSDTALSVFEKHDHTAAVIEEAKQNAQNFKFSFMLCMFALSVLSILTIPLLTIQHRKKTGTLWQKCSIVLFNQENSDGELLESVHNLRCAVMPRRYLIDRSIPMAKNHFVPLCKPIGDLEPGEHYFLPKLPMLSQPADDHIRSHSHTKIVPDRVASSKQKPVEISRKRKQLSLDALLTKKKN